MSQGALPGIKVDQGLQPLSDSPDETLTQGLDGLNERCAEYFQLGAKFTKWRAVIKIDGELPTAACIESNMQALADYAKIVQDNNMVPMVEPEVLMDGNHSIERCYEVSSAALKALFASLAKNDVNIQGTILKPNMVTAGSLCESQASVQEVAEMTVRCLQENVPADLPGITFLSGGQSEINATAHLDAMNKIGGFPWKLSFSYGRALQQAALKTWLGKSENILDAQAVFSHRALMNKLAAEGAWSSDKELN
jgi:fructose-bisphosphate aldolase class I